MVLPADTYGSHLHNGETVDDNLEKANFEAAGAALAEIWNGLVIDGKALVSEYVSEGVDQETKDFQVTAVYKSRHLIQTQYMTTVLKCDDRSCCSPFKTSVGRFFPCRRIPPLIPVKFISFGPVALELEPNVYQKQLNFLDVFQRLVMEKELTSTQLKLKYKDNVPYDVFFPSQQLKIDGRICKVCSQYFAVQLSLKEHKRICKKPRKAAANNEEIANQEAVGEEEVLVEEVEDELELVELRPLISIPQRGGVEKILSLKEWLKSPWTLVDKI